MAQLGRINRLRVVKHVDFGVYLDGDENGEILLPAKQVPPGTQDDDMLDVFLYNDSEDRLIATTEKPFAMVGEFAYLQVVAVSRIGAFLDWGLVKNLLVPFSEQKLKMVEGRKYLVYIYIDEITMRIAASARLARFMDKRPPDYLTGQEVELIISARADLGYTAIVNGRHLGLLYGNEIFQPLHIGQRISGFVKKIRDDYKIDLSLSRPGYQAIDTDAQTVLQLLTRAGGFMAVSDKSLPEQISHLFGMSKKAFKKAIGALYKQRLISIDNDGIRTV